MISKEEIKTIQNILEKVQNPVYLFDDDPDGLCSFTLLYKHLQKGHGIIVKNSPEVKSNIFGDKIDGYNPDCIIILDKPMVEEEFLDHFNCPIIWIDHHEPQNPKQKHVTYANPLNHSKENTPTSRQVWEIVKKANPENLWIATTGCVGDWFYPKDMIKELKKVYPSLIVKGKTAPECLFTEDIGIIVKTIYFNLKGKMSDVQTAFKVFTRIEEPDEIIKGSTPKGKLLKKQFDSINKEYVKIKQNVLDLVTDNLFVTGIIPQRKYSFSSELSNEIFFMYPKKIIIVGRSSSGSTKGSIRTSYDINLPDIVHEAIVGLDGYGGGHKQAVGFCVKDEDFDMFINKVKELIEEKITS